MTLSRRSFLKVAGLTAVSIAGASMFTGCSAFTFTPVEFVAASVGDSLDENVKAFLAAVENKKVQLWPGDAYKNAEKCKDNLLFQMKLYGIDTSKIEFTTVTYVEATEDKAAYVEVKVAGLAKG